MYVKVFELVCPLVNASFSYHRKQEKCFKIGKSIFWIAWTCPNPGLPDLLQHDHPRHFPSSLPRDRQLKDIFQVISYLCCLFRVLNILIPKLFPCCRKFFILVAGIDQTSRIRSLCPVQQGREVRHTQVCIFYFLRINIICNVLAN